MAFTFTTNNIELQNDEFYGYISAIPGITRDEFKLLNDIRHYLQTPEQIDLLICLDKKVHDEPGEPKANEPYCDNERVNKRASKLIYDKMSAAQARYFVNKFESLHPEIFAGVLEHDMHQPVSTSVGTIYLFSSDNNCTELNNQIKEHSFNDEQNFTKIRYESDLNIPSPQCTYLRQQTFPEINEWTEKLQASTGNNFITSLPKKAYGLAKKSFDKNDPHGLLLNNDAAKPARVQQIIPQIESEIQNHFDKRVKLMDQIVNVVSINDANKTKDFFNIDIEEKNTKVDPNGSKLCSKKISNKILYAYIERFIDDNIGGGKYIQD